jgi:NADH-quinone oxidoreductase subunit M
MISHGISTGALFLLLGMMYERRHTRLIADFGGIGRVAPWFATAFMITALASIGLPGTSGFVGEFLALLGTFQARPIMGIIAGTGVIFAAYYMLPMVQKVFFNALEKKENQEMEDLSRREMVILVPMLALMIWIGVQPTPFLERMEPSVQAVLHHVTGDDLQALSGPAEEAPVVFSSTIPLEGEGEHDEHAPDHSGDEE